MPVANDAVPGTAAPELWQPYKVWQADMWSCQGCGATIAVGFSRQPIWERNYTQPQPAHDIAVNDC